ncbi:hypothetical protein V8F06_002141 [Rhypophila decipiens]
MIDFRALPKIEVRLDFPTLHAHLSGSISRQCLHEVWLKKKGESAQSVVDLPDPLIEMPEGKHDYDLTTFFPLFSRYIYRLVDTKWALTYTTLSVLQDFAADGVVYLELRTTPRAMPQAALSKADYIQTILDAISQFESAQSLSHDANPSMKTNLILTIDRRNSLPEAEEVLSLIKQFFNKGVVGLDLAGDPARTEIQHLAPVFQKAKREIPGLGVTLHFGEAESSGTDDELDMLLLWGPPDRLGHVIHLSEGIKEKVIRRGGVGLELCLSCNVKAGMITGDYGDHHFQEWYKVKNCNIVLGTDDVGVFGSPLSNEYALVAEHFGLSRSEICALARQGIDVIFSGEEEKERLRRLMWHE